jgi:hypothetical protein
LLLQRTRYNLDVPSLLAELRAELVAGAGFAAAGALGRLGGGGGGVAGVAGVAGGGAGSMRGVHRTALLASTRLALLLHLPPDTRWYLLPRVPLLDPPPPVEAEEDVTQAAGRRGGSSGSGAADGGAAMTPSRRCGAATSLGAGYRILRERRWESDAPKCGTVAEAWARVSQHLPEEEEEVEEEVVEEVVVVEEHEAATGGGGRGSNGDRGERRWGGEGGHRGRVRGGQLDAGPESGDGALPAGWHTKKILELLRAEEAGAAAARGGGGGGGGGGVLDRALVAVASSPAGCRTLWDGNHRAIALYGAALRARQRRRRQRRRQAAGGIVGGEGAEAPEETVDVVLGVAAGLREPHKGNFFCGEDGGDGEHAGPQEHDP